MHRPGWILGLSLTLFASVGCRDDPMSPTAPDPTPATPVPVAGAM